MALASPRISTGVLIALFAVLNAPANPQEPHPPPGQTHTYYIAADEVVWDYSPHGRNLTGIPTLEEDLEGRSPADKRYLKAIYREYTDATFKTLKPRPPEWEHLGILGPLIRAEVGDTVKVVFKNNSRMPYASMHPHGLAYGKDSEGALYNDNARVDKGAHVQPGQTFTYTWSVPERAGPGPHLYVAGARTRRAGAR